MNYTHKLARRLARLRPAAVFAACGRWSSDRKIGNNRAVQHHLVCRTLPILTLDLLMAAFADSSAPLPPDGGVADMYQVGRGWARRLVGIRISPDTAVVSPGQTIAFKAFGVLSDSSLRPITVEWAATGGTIDSAGLFTADSTMGTYQVVGTEPTLGLADTAAVVDTAASVSAPAPDAPPPAVSSVSVSPSSATLTVGESVQLSAAAKDVNGSPVDGSPITWTTSNSAVASVTSSGVVKALAGGSAKVTATAQGVSGEAAVSVTAPAPTPAPPLAGDCSDYSYTRLVSVSTASELSTAITDAQPGDLIQLAPGTYSGSWTVSRSGTATNPIMLCGPRTAVLNGGSLTNGGAVLKFIGTSSAHVQYWVAKGFTVTNRQVGVGGSYASWITVDSVQVYNLGEAAIAFQQFSTHNTWIRNYIHDTGKTTAQYGEGFYIGSYNLRWVNGQPDRTDYNTISDNIIGPNIGSELIQIDEGTTGNVLTGNHLDRAGRGYAGSGASIFIIGNEVVASGNVITNVSGTDNGVYVETILSGWGENNSFDNNTLTGSGVAGYGFQVRSTTNTVKCTNVVTGFTSGFSNIACTR
jgi:hypothetical protein